MAYIQQKTTKDEGLFLFFHVLFFRKVYTRYFFFNIMNWKHIIYNVLAKILKQ